MGKTLKNTPEEELGFINKVVRKSLLTYGSTWDMTLAGATALSLVSSNNPGVALYMLDVIDPQPNSIITYDDVMEKFPLGFLGLVEDREATWDKFRRKDQRAVFKR